MASHHWSDSLSRRHSYRVQWPRVGRHSRSCVYDRRSSRVFRCRERRGLSRDPDRPTLGGQRGCGDESAVLVVLGAPVSTPGHRWHGAADARSL